jgi:RNA polymerase sigma factor (sigma-70 family)
MRKSEMTDQALIKSYVSGDQMAFACLLERHQSRLLSYIYKLVKDPELAQDLFQDTFIRIVNTLQQNRYNDEGKFLPWAMRIAHNLVIDHFRKSKRMPTYTNDKEDFDIFSVLKHKGPDAEEIMINTELENKVMSVIAKLPNEQKEVLYMRHYAELSFQEIADQTGVSINTALGRMRYALLNLKKMLLKFHPELQYP